LIKIQSSAQKFEVRYLVDLLLLNRAYRHTAGGLPVAAWSSHIKIFATQAEDGGGGALCLTAFQLSA